MPNESSYTSDMSAELESLEGAIADFDREADDDFVDPGRLSAAIDRLQGKLCRVLAAARKRGDHLVAGQSAAPGWRPSAGCPRPRQRIDSVSASSWATCPG